MLLLLGVTADGLISIHALREEGDLWYLLSKNDGVYFYPRPPRGGRLLLIGGAIRSQNISIHALREEGDAETGESDDLVKISIHALREEGDITASRQSGLLWDFYPRPPRGGRHRTGSL